MITVSIVVESSALDFFELGSLLSSCFRKIESTIDGDNGMNSVRNVTDFISLYHSSTSQYSNSKDPSEIVTYLLSIVPFRFCV